MGESRDNLLNKITTLEKLLTEIRSFIARPENNPIIEKPSKYNPGIIVESLRKENEILKRDVDQLHLTLAGMKDSEYFNLEKHEALEKELGESEILLSRKDKNLIAVELEMQDLNKFVDSLKKENETLKCDKSQLALTLNCLKNEMASNVEKSDTLIQELKNQLATQKDFYENKIKSLSEKRTAIGKKLEVSSQELAQIKSKISEMESEANKRDESVQELKNQLASEKSLHERELKLLFEKHSDTCKKLEASIQALKPSLIQKLKDRMAFQERNFDREKHFYYAEMDYSRQKYESIRRNLDASREDLEVIKRKNGDLESQLENCNASVKAVEDQLILRKRMHDMEVQSLSSKLQTSNNKLEEIRLIRRNCETPLPTDEVKKLITQINRFMDNGDIDNAIKTCKTIFNVRPSNSDIIHTFSNIYRMKEYLNSLENKLRDRRPYDDIEYTYGELKKLTYQTNYPKILVQAEKKINNFLPHTRIINNRIRTIV